MPIINLTSHLNTQGTLGEIPFNTVREIFNQSSGMGAQIQIGDTLMTIQVINLGSFGRFSGHINSSSLSAELQELAENNMQNIYRHVWDYRDELGPRIEESERAQVPDVQSLSDRIDTCNFIVVQENLLLSAEHLTCPITLSIPERGVFVRTSLRSDVCCLYDSAALKTLVSQRLPHPVSRELMTEAHIVPKEQCHFDPEKGAFIHSASE